MKLIKSFPLLCLLAAALAVAACGNDNSSEQASVKQSAQQYFQAMNTGDVKQLSGVLAIQGQNLQAAQNLAAGVAKNFKNTFDAARLRELQQAIQNSTVAINGNKATINLKNGPAGMGPYQLVKLDGKWRLELPRGIQGVGGLRP